jgi:hypothetical protein
MNFILHLLTKIPLYVRLSVLAVLAVSLSFLAGSFDGARKERQRINEAVAKQHVESKKNADKTATKVQSLDDVQLDRYLCDLGIVRSNKGCQ